MEARPLRSDSCRARLTRQAALSYSAILLETVRLGIKFEDPG